MWALNATWRNHYTQLYPSREKEKVPSLPTPHETRPPPHDPFQFIQQNEGGETRGGGGPHESHTENFETRAQKLWRDSTEQFDVRQGRWMGEERPREKSRLKTHSNLKEEVISDLNSGTIMLMITMSRGPEVLVIE